eukprot:NODE_65_length_23997_cov_0.327601.p13 type:complete len:199 gc:universal NODE_65_length_23997_cov_0.327601:23055-23651(+)
MEPALYFISQDYEFEFVEHYSEYLEKFPRIKAVQPFIWMLFYLNGTSALDKWFGITWKSGYKSFMLVRFIQTLLISFKKKFYICDRLYRLSLSLDFICLVGSFSGITHAVSFPQFFLRRSLDFTGYSVGMVVNNHQIITEHYYTLIAVVLPIIYWLKDMLKKSLRPPKITKGCKFCGKQDILMPTDGACYVCLALANA